MPYTRPPHHLSCVLVTGGSGFIGIHLIQTLFERYGSYIQIINIDKLTYASHPTWDTYLQTDTSLSYHFIQGDITSQSLVQDILETYPITSIFHCAAETHVDTSIENPGTFLYTNIWGTYSILETLRLLCGERKIRFLQVSTDEVYGSLSLQDTHSFTEMDQYHPNSPYSVSKASADMLVDSYVRMYSLDAIVSHSTNNFGPFQHNEKLIPTVIHCVQNKKRIPVYGTGKNIRSWIPVREHCNALLHIMNHGQSGEHYNIGIPKQRGKATTEYSNLSLIYILLDIIAEETNISFDELCSLLQFVPDRRGHDMKYSVNTTKLQSLGWSFEHSTYSFRQALRETVLWYYNHS